MKLFLTFICFIFSNLISAQTEVINSKELKTELDKLIETNNKLAMTDKSYSEIKSYWIVFSSRDNQDRVDLIANFYYYSSKNMIGYFEYNGKIVSVYEEGQTKSDNFIQKEYLKKGKIEELVDYDDDKSVISLDEPDVVRYRILKTRLKKIN